MKIYEINNLSGLKVNTIVLESQPFHLANRLPKFRIAISDSETPALLATHPNAIHISDKGRTRGWYQNLVNGSSDYGVKNLKCFKAMLPPPIQYIAQTVKRAKIRDEEPNSTWADILIKADIWNGQD